MSIDLQELKVFRGAVPAVNIYEVTELELTILEKGPATQIFLNFAIGLLSVASTFLVSLCTIDINTPKTYYSFFCITVIGYIIGIILGVLWFRNRGDISSTVTQIKSRLTPEDDFKLILKRIELLKKIKEFEDSHHFLSVKFLKETKFAGKTEDQQLLQDLIDRKVLTTYRRKNPKKSKRPVLCCEIDYDHPLVKQAFSN